MTRTDLKPDVPTWAVVSRDGTIQTLTELAAGQTLSTTADVSPHPSRAEAVAAAQSIDAAWTDPQDEVEVETPATPRPPTDAARIAALEARLDSVAALAEAANTTAQEVARAAKPAGRP